MQGGGACAVLVLPASPLPPLVVKIHNRGASGAKINLFQNETYLKHISVNGGIEPFDNYMTGISQSVRRLHYSANWRRA
jgi:hypothetical protein